MADTPTPRSTEELLTDIRDEIVGLRQDLEAARGGGGTTVPDGKVELTEPK